MPRFLVQETQHDLSGSTNHSVLVPDFLADDHLGQRDFVDRRGSRDDIPHLGRMLIAALDGHDRYRHAVRFALLDWISSVRHHPVPRTFKEPDIIGVMYDSHLVRFIVSDRERGLKIHHNAGKIDASEVLTKMLAL